MPLKKHCCYNNNDLEDNNINNTVIETTQFISQALEALQNRKDFLIGLGITCYVNGSLNCQ